MREYYYDVVPLVRLPRTAGDVYTYSTTGSLSEGILVAIRFRNKRIRGVVIARKKTKPPYAVKPIIKAITKTPYVTKKELLFAKKLAAFYLTPLPDILKLFIPDRIPLKILETSLRRKQPVAAASKQETLYAQTTPEKDILLLIPQLKKILSNKGKVLFLVPTIPQLELLQRLFKKQFPTTPVVGMHSKLSAHELGKVLATVTDDGPAICVGLRQSVFLPYAKLACIVVYDSAHDAYKQWDLHPKYHVREVLAVRNELLPTQTHIFSYYPSYAVTLRLATKTIVEKTKPDWDAFSNTRFIHIKTDPAAFHPLDASLQQTYRNAPKHERWLFFLNRKGYSRFIVCGDCGWEARCPVCDLLLIKKAETELLCTRCNYSGPLPLACPECHNVTIKQFGVGTASLNEYIAALRDGCRPVRIEGSLGNTRQFQKAPVIIGTDTVFSMPTRADFDHVVVVNADAERSSSHWAQEELFIQKIWHLLHFKKPSGEFAIQSRQVDTITPLFAKRTATAHTKQILTMRKKLFYPPFGTLFLLTKKVKANEILEQPKELKAFLFKRKRIAYSAQRYTDNRGTWHRIIIRTPLPDTSFKKKLYAIVPRDWQIEINPRSL